jgi:hypothetical protein
MGVRRILAALLGTLALAGAAGAQDYVPPAAHQLTLGRGAWSYFGDARAIAHGRNVFTGWISTRGDVWVAEVDTRTLEVTKRLIYRDLGVDDHNNPSLVWFHGRLMAFFCEHSGRVLGRHAKMRYRVARGRYTLADGFRPVQKVGTNTPGGLGCTYPNPVVSGEKLFLFWRGGDWNPTFSVTTDARHWAKARTLVTGPGTRRRPERPYAKYAEGPGDSFAMAFSDGHPKEWANSLYFLEYRDGAFYKPDGTLVGTLDDVPFTRDQVDVLYRYQEDLGRAWPHDVAFDRGGHPVVAYTRRLGGPSGVDYFHFARWTGSGWSDEQLTDAGAGAHTFTSGGMSLLHERPKNVLLSRTEGQWNQIELWTRPDVAGGTWSHYPLTANQTGFSIRPVFPRGFTLRHRAVVLYFEGTANSFQDYDTRIKMLVYDTEPAR